MVDAYNHCVKVSCSKTYPLANKLDPGTYFICNKNRSKTVEETFCSVQNSTSCSTLWLNGTRLETFLYDVSENRSENENSCLGGGSEKHYPCFNNSNCCFTNFTTKLLQERSCNEYSACDGMSVMGSAAFTEEEEDMGNLYAKIFIAFFMVIGLMAVLGNLAVIVHSFQVLFEKKIPPITERQIYHVLILNLSFADFAMGMYVLALISSSINFLVHHSYGNRSARTAGSTFCVILGFINFAASQISVTAIGTIAGLRLFSVLYPYKLVRLRVILWVVIVTWVFWIFVALIPPCTSGALRSVFADEIRIAVGNEDLVQIEYSRLQFMLERIFEGINTECGFSSNQGFRFSQRPSWTTLLNVSKQLQLVESNVEDQVTFLGYYNAHWVCTMKFFQTYQNLSSLFTLPIVLFNVSVFSFILVAQFVIAWKTSTCCHFWKCFTRRPTCCCTGQKRLKTKNRDLTEQQKREIENRRMHRRMFFIVMTDFCCWIPLSIMTLNFYVKSYYIEACELARFKRHIELWTPALIMFVIPINSSINPFIYSFRFWASLLKKFFSASLFFQRCRKKDENVPTSSISSPSTDSLQLETESSRANLKIITSGPEITVH